MVSVNLLCNSGLSEAQMPLGNVHFVLGDAPVECVDGLVMRQKGSSALSMFRLVIHTQV